ncbi:aminotransferase class V-fold PLP-dependent enzyme [Lysobacter enzymogenes]|uniref:aminotransferase class V-fold PLP-dependent enzyme n=1 Tax=Lysobacter enzymogenes TaxID=69 RepID=UPI002264CC12|nr:aminotransferase class V-fold PLP-dependent enzyme [Lysobacter enzymogenes]UZW62166.1 aminotransferase class V-fold PLP-dependent enzyme [Lysobacter enzymogenes]
MEFYERVLGPRLFKPYGELLAREIRQDIRPDAPPASILEVACGTGRITTALYDDLAKPLGLRLVATDLSKIAVDMAKQSVGEELLREVAFHSDVDMADMPFADDSFDIIVCGFGLMFPPDKVRVAREFKRVLRPGGRVYATVFQYNELFDLALQQSQARFGTPSAIMGAALSLADPAAITRAFFLEGLGRDVDGIATSCPLSFFLDDADTREFLFNACILLEEFNQCDAASREGQLDEMLHEFHAQVPSRNYRVKAWLLRGQVGLGCKESAAPGPQPDFSELDVFCRSPVQLIEDGAGEPRRETAMQPLRSYRAMKAAFLAEYPAYPEVEVEALRSREFSRLDACHVAYLDHVGGTLAAESLLDEDCRMLKTTVLGNPHSGSKPSQAAYEKARAEIYRFFHCAPEEYEIVFTPNASGAIRLVAESFPFESGSDVLLAKDNHTSVHGLREYAKAKGASVRYIPLDPELRILDSSMQRSLDRLAPGRAHLLAYPAQSNATGVRHDLKWIRIAQERGAMVLCDAAALVPQSVLDCSEHRPDFVAISFYKIFGHPTGAGCLIAKRSSLRKLTPPSFSGARCATTRDRGLPRTGFCIATTASDSRSARPTTRPFTP